MSRKDLRQRRAAVRASFERSPLRAAIVLAVALKIALVILVFDRAGLDAFDLPKSLVSRAFAWLLLGLIVAAIVQYGPRIVPRTRLYAFVAALLVATVVSAVFAESTYVALFGERDRYLGLTFLADMLVLSLAVAVAFRGPRDWVILLGVAGGAGAVSLAYAVVQFAGLDPIQWQIDSHARPFGTFGHPDMFGQFLSFTFAAAIGIAVAAGPRQRPMRVAATLGAVVALAGIGIVATRGSALGIAAALALIPLVVLRLHPGAKRQLARTAGIGLVAFVVVAGLVLVSPLGARLRATAQGFAIEDRLVIYENAISAFRDKPIVGWGPDAFAVAYPHYRQSREPFLHGLNTIHTSAHDWALETAATTGMLGLAALLALIAATALALWRGLARMPIVAAPLLLGSAAYWAHGLVSVGSIDLDWFPWTVVGAAAAFAGTTGEEAWTPPVGVPRYAPAVVAAAAGLFLAYGPLVANQQALTAELENDHGSAQVAAQQAESAVANDSGRARYWSILGSVRQRAGQFRAAAQAHEGSTSRAPYIAAYWVNLASARAGQAVSGDDRANARAAAFDAARRAVSVDPNEPVPHVTLARVAAEFGDQETAQAEITRAIALWPHDPDYDKVAAGIAAQNKDGKAAVAFLESLLRYKDTSTLRDALAAAKARS